MLSEYQPVFEILPPERPKKLLEQMRHVIRLKHYSIRTEETYVHWAKRYILFHHKRHPKEMGASEIIAFLKHLAVNINVSASTQNQAFNALLLPLRGRGGEWERGRKI